MSIASGAIVVRDMNGCRILPAALMLHSFGLRFKPWNQYAEAIRAEISRREIWIFANYREEGKRYFLQIEECSLTTSEVRTV